MDTVEPGFGETFEESPAPIEDATVSAQDDPRDVELAAAEMHAARTLLLDLLRNDPEVQGAVLALLARAVVGGGVAGPDGEAPPKPKPAWVMKTLAEQGKS